MPTSDALDHLPVHNLSHMGRVVVVDGCLDVGPSKTVSYHLAPVRFALRSECPEKDLDTILDLLVKNREALKAKIRSALSIGTVKPTGPRKKHPKD